MNQNGQEIQNQQIDLLNKMEKNLKNLPKINWFNIYKSVQKHGTKSSFRSDVGIELEYSSVLTYIWYNYLAETRKFLKKVTLLWFFSWTKEYRSYDSNHVSWHKGYHSWKRDVHFILDKLNEKMDLVSWKLIFLDWTFNVEDRIIVGDVDTTEFFIEKPTRKKNQMINKFEKLNDYRKDPTYSGKQRHDTLKYEISSSIIIGFVLMLVGPVNGPMADQDLSRAHQLDLKIQEIGKCFSKPITFAGDGHYTNFQNITDRTKFFKSISRYKFHAIRSKIECFNGEIKKKEILTKNCREGRGNLKKKKKKFILKL